MWLFLLKTDVVWKVAVFGFLFKLDIYSSCKYRFFVCLLRSKFPIFYQSPVSHLFWHFVFFLSILSILASARDVIVILKIFMVVPVAKLHCSKKLRISIMIVQLLRKDWYHRHIVII